MELDVFSKITQCQMLASQAGKRHPDCTGCITTAPRLHAMLRWVLLPFKLTEAAYWDFSPGQIPDADLRPRSPGPFSPLPEVKAYQEGRWQFSLLYRSSMEEPLGPAKAKVVLRHRSGLLQEKILVSTRTSQRLVPAGAPHNKPVVTSTRTSAEAPLRAVSRRAPRHLPLPAAWQRADSERERGGLSNTVVSTATSSTSRPCCQEVLRHSLWSPWVYFRCWKMGTIWGSQLSFQGLPSGCILPIQVLSGRVLNPPVTATGMLSSLSIDSRFCGLRVIIWLGQWRQTGQMWRQGPKRTSR